MRGIRPPRLLRAGRSAKAIGDIVERVLQGAAFSLRMVDRETVAAWENVVGPEVSRHAHVVAFRGGTLHVEVDSAVWLHELGGFHKENILDDLRQQLRGRFIEDLAFQQQGSAWAEPRTRKQGRE